MLVIYDSKTGNVEDFVSRLGMRSLKIPDTIEELIINEPYVLVTYTTGFGEIPVSVKEFLENNHEKMVAVAASGNKIWGANYGKSADIIAEKYNVPILLKFELRGSYKDIDLFRERVQKFETH